MFKRYRITAPHGPITWFTVHYHTGWFYGYWSFIDLVYSLGEAMTVIDKHKKQRVLDKIKPVRIYIR